jgi:ribulose-5-phosphate 4-epimerase/fuculose-1-phosphate aldolase
VVHHLGWCDLIFNHITARVPGPERHFLINPFGLRYDEVTASNLVLIDLDGRPVRPTPWPVNAAGFVVHGAVHRHRDDAHVVLHTHTREGMAVACKAEGLSHDSFYGAMLTGEVAYHPFEGVSVHEGEMERLAASLGPRQMMILRNHGLLSCGPDVPTGFFAMWLLQRACETQCDAQALTGPPEILSPTVRDRTRQDRKRSRIDWLIDGLGSEELELRSAAWRELAALVGDDFGYRPDADKRSRQRAIEVWQQWWQAEQQQHTHPKAAAKL